jgi:hypothetical protein
MKNGLLSITSWGNLAVQVVFSRSAVPPHLSPALSWGAIAQDYLDGSVPHYDVLTVVS